MVNSTNRGGRVSAWVANSTRGALPPRGGGGVAATISVSQAFSRPVGDPPVPGRERGPAGGGRQLVDGPAGQRRDVDARRPGHPGEVAVDLALEQQPAVLVEQVPLVEGEDERPAGVDDLADHPLVLLGDRLAGVEQDDGHLGGLDRGRGAQAGVVLHARWPG